MATTEFTNNVTLTDADWFNDVDRVVYDILGDPADASAVRTALSLSYLNNYIQGLTQSAAGGSANITFTSGQAVDATAAAIMTLAASITKTTSSWAVGTNQGGLDTGSIANNTQYYFYLIRRPDTGVVDVLFSTSASSPTMPDNYTQKRLIGWMRTDGSAQWVKHTSYELPGGGLHVLWGSIPQEIGITNTLTTTRRLDTLGYAPNAFTTEVELQIAGLDASVSWAVHVCCPDQDDQTPAFSSAPEATIGGSANARAAVKTSVRTSASGQIASKSGVATLDEYYVSNCGFKWSRR